MAATSLAMTTPTTAFVWGFRARGYFRPFDTHAELARTDDGGRTWHVVPGAPRENYQSEAVSDVTFVSPTIGYLWGRRVYRTVDGGLTWRPLRVPSHRVDELSGSDGYAWALAPACSGPSCLKETVFRIDPDGRIERRDIPPTRVDADDRLGGTYDGLQTLFTGEKDRRVELWLQGPSGGWVGRRTPCDFAALDAIGADNEVHLLCTGEPGAGEQLTQAWVSGDGGRTWSHRSSPGEFGYPTGLDVAAGTWILSRERGSIQTSNDGRRWRPARFRAPKGYTGGEGFDQIDILADGVGAALPADAFQGDTRLAYTTDYGREWTTRKVRIG